ncbi:MAG: glycoside hydrolase family 88 protein, partial [Spirochaetes bacterium]|nr:glycoside hydrolase family 88 protein [Spirochaetota bacterium]
MNNTISIELSWAERMAKSEMYRRKDSLQYQKSSKGQWDYTTGLLLLGLEKLWEKTKNEEYYQYIKKTIDSYVNKDGTINSYKVDEYNIDQINCGRVLFNLYETTKEEKYKKAIFILMSQLETHPRTKENGFWHKKIYPYQMWLDGIYMGHPFYAQFSKTFDKPENFDDIAHQILLITEKTKDKKTGLLYHAWDETKKMYWANPQTGQSPNFWSRAIGWYGMGILDMLDFFPEDHPKIKEILNIFKDMIDAVLKYMDKKTGLWYQVTDHGD